MGSVLRVLGAVLLICLIGFLMRPRIFVYKKSPERTEAINYGKQIWLALLDHRERYGSFPNEETMRRITTEKGITPFPLKTSNDYFRLLITGGLTSEKIGYCHYPALPAHRPDGVISPLEQAFAKGEVGFAYLANIPADAPPDTPVLVAPLIPRTLQFDPKPYNGHAIVVFLDGSAKSMTLRQGSNLVMVSRDRMLFDPDAPWWNGKTPELKYPAR